MDKFSPGIQGVFPAKVVSKLRTDGNQELSAGGQFQTVGIACAKAPWGGEEKWV